MQLRGFNWLAYYVWNKIFESMYLSFLAKEKKKKESFSNTIIMVSLITGKVSLYKTNLTLVCFVW